MHRRFFEPTVRAAVCCRQDVGCAEIAAIAPVGAPFLGLPPSICACSAARRSRKAKDPAPHALHGAAALAQGRDMDVLCAMVEASRRWAWRVQDPACSPTRRRQPRARSRHYNHTSTSGLLQQVITTAPSPNVFNAVARARIRHQVSPAASSAWRGARDRVAALTCQLPQPPDSVAINM